MGLGLEAFSDVPVRIAFYDGSGKRVLCDPVEIGYTGDGEKPEAVVITVIAAPADE